MCSMDEMPNPDRWCSIQHAIDFLKVSRLTVWRMMDEGLITRYEMVGGRPMIWLAELEELKLARERAGMGAGRG